MIFISKAIYISSSACRKGCHLFIFFLRHIIFDSMTIISVNHLIKSAKFPKVQLFQTRDKKIRNFSANFREMCCYLINFCVCSRWSVAIASVFGRMIVSFILLAKQKKNWLKTTTELALLFVVRLTTKYRWCAVSIQQLSHSNLLFFLGWIGVFFLFWI